MNDRFEITADIEILEQYDQDADIYYVTMKTGEPSVVKEHDDRLLVEFGMFTHLPTGFRILNYSKNKKDVEQFKEGFKNICRAAGLRKIKIAEGRQRQMERRIDKFFEMAGT